MINVTRTFLPPLNEYNNILQRAWNKHWITNRGELVKELEEKLTDFLKVHHMTLTCNGTVPIQIAIKSLQLKGEIITTPFSYVASTSTIFWENCTPVFVDIDPEHLTLNDAEIENAITDKTTAILATHVFGNPCNVEMISKIAKQYNLKVIYDAAHAFGVSYKNESLFNFGDVSTCSFHATKIFHTGEGGAMFTTDSKLHEKLYYHHNFGHKGPEAFHGLGINGKMSELNAALGLAIFPYLDELIKTRKSHIEKYKQLISGYDLQLLKVRESTDWNYSYFPVIFNTESQLVRIKEALEDQEIHARRYFYPALNSLNYIAYKPAPVAESISKRILCLPLYHELSDVEIEEITRVIKKCL